jgi:hypothetical protein
LFGDNPSGDDNPHANQLHLPADFPFAPLRSQDRDLRLAQAVSLMDISSHQAAVECNLAELQRAIINCRAMVAMEGVGISNDWLKVIYYALFND